jgi:hypothetical protein
MEARSQSAAHPNEMNFIFNLNAFSWKTMQPAQIYEVRLRKDHRGIDLISDALPFGRLWYAEPNAISNAIGYAKHRSRSHRAMLFLRLGTVLRLSTLLRLDTVLRLSSVLRLAAA